MPIYEYECKTCGKRVEVEQRITAEPLTTHRECAETPCDGDVKRLITRTSFILKGRGWAKDGYGG